MTVTHWAAVPTLWPVLEEWTAAGWVHLADLGIPAGLPKTMTRPLPELAGRAPGRLRIRSNVQVYWDRIALGVPEAVPATRSLPVSRATLAHRGFLQEVTPARGSRHPVEYREDRLEVVSVTKWLGRLTRTGDVTPLLAAADDRFVLCGPGDEVTAEFDADLPPPPAGFVRTFVLRADGYCKDTSPFTKTGGQVGPLPYRGMASYPDGATAPPAAQAEYDRRWNTRAAGR